jgi:purine-binding chemotaxis protein CheW
MDAVNNVIKMPRRISASAQKKIGKFLAFRLGKEEYGLDMRAVQELRSYGPVMEIADFPDTPDSSGLPDFLKGFIHLHGIVVPIVDMRIKLNSGTPTYDQFTVVIIMDIPGGAMGMVVDSVSDMAPTVECRKPEQIWAPFWIRTV